MQQQSLVREPAQRVRRRLSRPCNQLELGSVGCQKPHETLVCTNRQPLAPLLSATAARHTLRLPPAELDLSAHAARPCEPHRRLALHSGVVAEVSAGPAAHPHFCALMKATRAGMSFGLVEIPITSTPITSSSANQRFRNQ